ncbi:hypothetical protein BV22DRAFT_1051339 [Leucogyrophana mollusca]|uniref:Uncharacterized protein n=1 Tax=Leucogyrophana mollusca TaxID=85980 RepID=A0ACB8AZM7_9AGAM|nr:hypothetical protein BV22DRAFT_1051339 [Leucogyrophana mollusca]
MATIAQLDDIHQIIRPGPLKLEQSLEGGSDAGAEFLGQLYGTLDSVDNPVKPPPLNLHSRVCHEDHREAMLVLEIVRVKCEVHRVQKLLANCVVKEHKTITSLHQFKAGKAVERIDDVDVGLGKMRITFKRHAQLVSPQISAIPWADSSSAELRSYIPLWKLGWYGVAALNYMDSVSIFGFYGWGSTRGPQRLDVSCVQTHQERKRLGLDRRTALWDKVYNERVYVHLFASLFSKMHQLSGSIQTPSYRSDRKCWGNKCKYNSPNCLGVTVALPVATGGGGGGGGGGGTEWRGARWPSPVDQQAFCASEWERCARQTGGGGGGGGGVVHCNVASGLKVNWREFSRVREVGNE